MALFSGTHRNKLDSKGRVSIPATFRSVLKKKSHAGEASPIATMYLRPSHKGAYIEGWAELDFEDLSEPVGNEFPLFSDAQDDLNLTLFGDAAQVDTDKEGRIILPDDLAEYAGLKDAVMFIGSRTSFQIWEPEAGARRMAEAREKVRSAGYSIAAKAAASAAKVAA